MLRLIAFFVLSAAFAVPAFAQSGQLIGSVARVKGQETTVVHGFGIVTGLKGTGDKASDFKEVGRSLGQMLALSGHPNITEKELGTSKSVALVYVTATIPGQGARDGELLDCTVSAVGSSQSLKDGFLSLTDLIGPVPQHVDQTQVFAKAWGQLTIEKPETPTVAKITNGARMTAEFRNPYVKDGCITLVLPEKHATWFMAEAIADAINSNLADQGAGAGTAEGSGETIALALDQQNIIVKVPQYYLSNPVEFVAAVNRVPLYGVDKVPMVTINERAGVIVIDQNVEIAPVTVSHKNVTIQAGGLTPAAPQPGQAEPPPPQRFVNLDVEGRMNDVDNVKLSALRDCLNAMKVPTQDVVAIIQSIDAQGALNGKIIYK